MPLESTEKPLFVFCEPAWMLSDRWSCTRVWYQTHLRLGGDNYLETGGDNKTR
jgi:hypothetical protein